MTPSFLPFAKPVFSENAIADVAQVLRSGWVTTGPKVQAFEAALTEYFGRPTRAFANGTCTMEVALRLCDIGPGDEVITTPISWVATANVILQTGARPVFADIDPVTRNIDLNEIVRRIGPRTKAIMPVHLAGLPCELTALYALAKKHGLRVIEDAAQAIHARHQGQRVGSFGDFASFSFQANKNLTTGEGGCLVLPDTALVARCDALRLQGVVRTGFDDMQVDEPGGKFNLNDMAAAIGLDQVPRLDAITAHRHQLAKHYFAQLNKTWCASKGIELPPEDFRDTNWHMFQLVLNPEKGGLTRAEFMGRMKEKGIGIGVHYPPIHRFALYERLGYRAGDFPVAERVGANIVSLPLHMAMGLFDVARVVEAIESVYQ